MNCHLCQEPRLAEHPSITQPCGCVVHTACGYRIIAEFFAIGDGWHGAALECQACQVEIYRRVNHHQIQQESALARITALKKTAGFKLDAAELKKKRIIYNNRLRDFKRVVSLRKGQFRNLIQPHVVALKAAVLEAKRDLRPAKRLFSTASRTLMASITRLKNKYNFTHEEAVFASATVFAPRRRRWYTNPCRILERTFHVKI